MNEQTFVHKGTPHRTPPTCSSRLTSKLQPHPLELSIGRGHLQGNCQTDTKLLLWEGAWLLLEGAHEASCTGDTHSRWDKRSHSLLLLPLRRPQKEGLSGVFAILPDAHLTAPCYLGSGSPVSRFRQLCWATHSLGPSGSTALSSKNRELGHFSRALAPRAHAEPAPGQCPSPPAPWMTGERDLRGSCGAAFWWLEAKHVREC